MGQSSSKPLSPKVYDAPEVTVGKSLRSDLEANPETDTVRQLYSEKYIEDRVAERLYDERVAIEKQLEENSSKIPEISDARIAETGGIDSRELRKQVSELHKELTSRPLRGQLDNEGKAAREKLVECLTTHKQQPLKCREVFAEFQGEITRIETKIASQ